MQARIGAAAASQNEHYGPVGIAEAPGKRFFVGVAGQRTVARMGMNPDPGKPGRSRPVESLGSLTKSGAAHAYKRP